MTQNILNIKKMKVYIESRNLTYTGLAEMIGVHPSTIFRYLRGDLAIPGPVMFIVNNDMCSCEYCRNGVK